MKRMKSTGEMTEPWRTPSLIECRFNILINRLFIFNMSPEIWEFTDDNTIYACGNDIHAIVMVLENDLCKLLQWFTCNGMVLNLKNCS